MSKVKVSCHIGGGTKSDLHLDFCNSSALGQDMYLYIFPQILVILFPNGYSLCMYNIH